MGKKQQKLQKMQKLQRQQKKQMAKKKKNKIIAFTLFAVVALIIGSFMVLYPKMQSNEHDRIFVNQGQTITLSVDGTFKARLAHGKRINGTYTEVVQNNETNISFTVNDVTVNTKIAGNTLTLPREWEDGHGHGSAFVLK